MAKFKLYLYFVSRADWVGNIMKEGLKPTSIHGSDEKGILLFFNPADAKQHGIHELGEDAHVLQVNCTGLKPTAFQDFYELREKATNPVLGQHIFFTEPIDPVRIKDLSVIQEEAL